MKLKMKILQTISLSFSYLESILLAMMDDEAFLDLPFMLAHTTRHRLSEPVLYLLVNILPSLVSSV